MVGTIITIIVIGWIGFNGYKFFSKKENLKLYKHIKDAFSWWMIPAAIIAIALVGVTGYTLYESSSIFRFSWLNLLGMNGGNILTGGGTSSSHHTSTSTSTHLSTSALLSTIMIPVIILPLIPLFAYAEEFKFRLGAEKRSLPANIVKCLYFGLIHMIVGVPLAVGIALSIGGAAFTMVYVHFYKKHYALNGEVKEAQVHAMDRSAAMHTTYNYLLLSVLIIGTTLTYFLQ